MTDRVEPEKESPKREAPDSPLLDYAASRSVLLPKEQSLPKTEPLNLDFSAHPDIYRSGPAERKSAASEHHVDAKESVDRRASPESRGAFVPEKMDEALLKKMKDFEIPQETLERALQEINKYGEEPSGAARSLMEKNRVLAMGEAHLSPNPQRDFGTQIMPELKKAGATHLAIEAPESIQPALDQYLKTGQLDPKQLPPLLRDQDYLDMLEAARKSGMKIVAVDANGKYQEASDGEDSFKSFSHRDEDNYPREDRDKKMSDNIGKILKEDPHNKVVFWVGSAHLSHSDNPNHKGAADLLKEHYSTATVKPVYDFSRGSGLYPLGELTSELRQPVAISTQKATAVGDFKACKFDFFPEHERDWDYIFAYPTAR